MSQTNTGNPGDFTQANGTPSAQRTVQTSPETASVPCEEPSTGRSGTLFTQQQVNDIAARESGKALERLFREVGCEYTGRAKEQQKEFVAGYLDMKRQLTEAASQLEQTKEQLSQTLAQNQQQQSEIARLNAANICLDCGINPETLTDALRLLPEYTDPESYSQNVKSLLAKYPFFAARSAAVRIPMPAVPTEETEKPQSRFASIAKKMGLA